MLIIAVGFLFINFLKVLQLQESKRQKSEDPALRREGNLKFLQGQKFESPRGLGSSSQGNWISWEKLSE